MKKLAVLGLSFLLLFPSFLDMAHVLAHEHEFCKVQTVHIHQKNVDCEFFKFHPSPFFSTEFSDSPKEIVALPERFYPETYQFLSDYQKMAFSLRGPPVM